MRVRTEIVWDGVDQLKKYLNNTIPYEFREAYTEALQKAAYDGKERAQILVPVDTGALRDSIRIERYAQPAGNITYTGIAAGGYKRNPKTGKIVNYAGYVEFGTSRQRPQPYLRPATEWAIKRVPNYFWSALSRRVEKP